MSFKEIAQKVRKTDGKRPSIGAVAEAPGLMRRLAASVGCASQRSSRERNVCASVCVCVCVCVCVRVRVFAFGGLRACGAFSTALVSISSEVGKASGLSGALGRKLPAVLRGAVGDSEAEALVQSVLLERWFGTCILICSGCCDRVATH